MGVGFAAVAALMALDGDSSKMVEVFCPHDVCASVFCLYWDANVVDEEEEVAEEDSIGDEIVGSGCG